MNTVSHAYILNNFSVIISQKVGIMISDIKRNSDFVTLGLSKVRGGGKTTIYYSGRRWTCREEGGKPLILPIPSFKTWLAFLINSSNMMEFTNYDQINPYQSREVTLMEPWPEFEVALFNVWFEDGQMVA